MAAFDPGPRDGAGSLPSRGRTHSDTHAFEVIPLEPKVIRRTEPGDRRSWAQRRDMAATAFYASLTILVSLLTVLVAAAMWRFLQSMGVL